MSDRNDEILALYALGVPVPLLAKEYGIKVATIHKYAAEQKVKRPALPDKARYLRVSKVERMQRHMAESPSKSLSVAIEAAA